MKVALTHPYAWPEIRRGAERLLAETARVLAQRGHEVTVFTTGGRAGREQRGAVTTVRFRRLLGPAHRHEQLFGLELLPHLVRGRFDVVHSFMPRDAAASVRARRVTGHRVVYQEVGNPRRSWWDTQPDRRCRMQLVGAVDSYACLSRYGVDLLYTDHGRRGELLPGGVRLTEFTPAPAREDRPTVLFSGAFEERRKGAATLLAAIDRLVVDHPDVQVWLSGPGDPTALLAEAPPRARDRTTVLPLGEPDALADRYGRAWVTALPSVGESFGLVLVESLACGTPIVVADHAASPELVSAGTGIVVPLDGDGDTGGAVRVDDLAAGLAAAMALTDAPGVADACRVSASAYDWDTAIGDRLEAIHAGG